MFYRLAADAVVVLHLAFIVFIVAGGFLTWRWPRLAFIHLPLAVWGVAVQWMGWVCPLTPLENVLRRAAGESGYTEGFVEHYIIPLVYSPGLTHGLQWAMGAVVLLANAVAYVGLVVRRSAERRRRSLHDRAS
ncbi:MAG: DUF2784 domain-containing protein [Myxococcota bacterium]